MNATEGHTRRAAVQVAIWGGAFVVGLFSLFFLSRANYLLFHVVVESFAAVVAAGIFVIAWNTRRIAGPGYLLTLGVAQLPIWFVVLLHAFAYKGMGVFPVGGANLPTQLWIVARGAEALAFVVAGLSIRRPVSVRAALGGFSAVVAAALASIWVWPIFPAMYVEGVGLTPVKVASEYAIMGLFAIAWWLVWRDRQRFDASVARLLQASIALMIAAEMAFTLYVDVYGALNFLGHYLALVGFVLAYRALIRTVLREPYAVLFRELTRREESERRIAETLQGAILSAPDRIAGVEIGHAHVSATRSARVGGDFWDLFTAPDGRVAFVLGDVCGKGVEAAATTVAARTMIRSFSYDDPDPAVVLARTNDALLRQLADDKFVTIVYGLVDVATGEVAVGSAGHPEPLLCSADTSTCLDLPRNPPLAVVDGREFEIGHGKLAPGDTLVLFSDGLIEAGDGGDLLGIERVAAHAGEHHRRHDPRGLAKSLLENAVAHAGGGVNDDVAIVVLRLNEAGC